MSHCSENNAERVIKAGGTDHECGNFVLGGRYAGQTDGIASSALLKEIDGYPKGGRKMNLYGSGPQNHQSYCGEVTNGGYWGRHRVVVDSRYDDNPLDRGRRYLVNGMAAYIDSHKLEICTPEVLSAHDFVATLHAAYRVVGEAQKSANRSMPEGERIVVLFNNSDGKGHSRGTHINTLLTRTAWENIFNRKLQYLLFLASHIASSQVCTGSGKVCVENDRPPVDYQISSRADFFTRLVDQGTMVDRPIVNSRFEPLAGSTARHSRNLARLHTIAYDANLCHLSNFLKFGCLQLVTAMIEGEWADCAGLILSDPVEAMVRFSHDPGLSARAQTISGEKLTAVELQLRICEEARRYADSGGFEETVPGVGEILSLWEETLLLLKNGEYSSLARRLDWVLKAQIILGAIDHCTNLGWDSPEILQLDSLYSSADREEGIYWQYEDAGLVETLATQDEIMRFTQSPPENTRAWGRSMILRKADADIVADVDWDRIRFRTKGKGIWSVTLDLGDPLSFTREKVGPVIEGGESFHEMLDALGAARSDNDSWIRCKSNNTVVVYRPDGTQSYRDHHGRY